MNILHVVCVTYAVYVYTTHHTVQAAKCAHFYHVCTLLNAWLVDEKHHQRKLQVMLTLKTFYILLLVRILL